MKRKAIKKVIGASIITGVFVAMATMILISDDLGVILTPEIEKKEMSFKPAVLPFLKEAPGADADPGGLASGVMNSYVSKLTETYAANLTDVWGSTTLNESSAGSDIPYNVNHELCVKVRWNKTHAYDTAWNLSLVRAYVNCTDLTLSGELAEETEIGHNDSFIWVNYHVDNSNAGFNLDRGDTVSDVNWNFEYYG